MRDSLRTRLTVSFIILAITPLLVVGVTLAWRSFGVQREQALALQSEIARRVAADTSTFLRDREDELRSLVEFRGIARLDTEQRVALLSGMISYQQNVYEELILLDRQGQEEIRLSRRERVLAGKLDSWSGRDEFEIPKANGEIYFSSVSVDDVTGEPFMSISIPLLDLRSGEFTGLLLAKFRFKTVWDLMSTAQVRSDSTVYLVDAQNKVIAHQKSWVVLRESLFEPPQEDGFYKGLDGTEVALATDKIQLHEQIFVVVAEKPRSEALNLAYSAVYAIAVAVVISLAIAIVVSIVVTRRILRPVEALARTAEAISGGDLSQQVEVTGRDEVGQLGQTFNSMTARLGEMLRNEEKRAAELEREISERKRAEAERERLQQEIIEAQQQAIQELSTPIIPVMERVIAMPLVGSIDSKRALDIMRRLLAGIRAHRARVVIIDITGVAIIDSGVASHLDKTIQTARLKGAQTILTGISDEVAETIVDLGIDWSGLITLRDLQTGLVAALDGMGLELKSKPQQKGEIRN